MAAEVASVSSVGFNSYSALHSQGSGEGDGMEGKVRGQPDRTEAHRQIPKALSGPASNETRKRGKRAGIGATSSQHLHGSLRREVEGKDTGAIR